MSDLFLAVETGGTKLQFVLGDAQGCIVQRSRLSVARERGFQGILEAVTAQVPLFSAAAAQNGARIAHIGVDFGGSESGLSPIFYAQDIAWNGPCE